MGSWGETGPQGPQGPGGVNGANGASGDNGTPGDKGERGIHGASVVALDGEKGSMGFKGSAGLAGPQGPSGQLGAQGSCLTTPSYSAWTAELVQWTADFAAWDAEDNSACVDWTAKVAEVQTHLQNAIDDFDNLFGQFSGDLANWKNQQMASLSQLSDEGQQEIDRMQAINDKQFAALLDQLADRMPTTSASPATTSL